MDEWKFTCGFLPSPGATGGQVMCNALTLLLATGTLRGSLFQTGSSGVVLVSGGT